MTSHPTPDDNSESKSVSSICSPQTGAQGELREPTDAVAPDQIRPSFPLKISGTGYIVDAKGVILSCEPTITHREYLVHAANAYPKLVAALNAVLAHYAKTENGGFGVAASQSEIAAANLLRELGELE